jgi:hypothetical protein
VIEDIKAGKLRLAVTSATRSASTTRPLGRSIGPATRDRPAPKFFAGAAHAR